jgi:uncharacterized protein YkwD
MKTIACALAVVSGLLLGTRAAGGQSREEVERAVFDLINQKRAEVGLPAYQLDERLVACARAHADDMGARHYCSHRGAGGSSPRARIAAHGYPVRWGSENMFCGRRSPEQVLNWWMNSRVHRAGILNPSYTHIGVGWTPSGTWGMSWVLNFALGAPVEAQ